MMATKPIFDDVEPWPVQQPNPRAVIGGNKPPLEEVIPAEFRAALLAERADFMTLMDNYLGAGDPNSEAYKEGAVQRAKVTNEETLGSCAKVINTLRAMEKHVSETHVAVKAPYLLGSNLCDAEKNALVGRINHGRDHVQGLMDDYANEQLRLQRIETARLAKERADELAAHAAEQRRLEDEARAKNAPAPTLAPPPPPLAPPPAAARQPYRTDGATVSMGTEWRSRVDNYTQAFKHVSADAGVRAAIDKAIQARVKATKGNNGKPLAGVTMSEVAKTSSR